MTEEIFRQDGYIFEFEARVVRVSGDKVELDSTAFYPGGGGQVCDTGSIRGHAVREVRYEGKDIVHIVPGHDLKVGDAVWCSVDWDRRYDLMMGHTGEHILFSSLKRQDPDISIVKIYISPESKYVIVDRPVGWEAARGAVEFANRVIRDNHRVVRSMMERDDPEMERIRVNMERIGEGEQISVVEIGDVDIAACSGIHVMETSELSCLFVDRIVSAGREGYAVHFRIGAQAVDSAMALANTCLQAAEAADSKPEDIVRAVSNMKRELDVSRGSLKAMAERELAEFVPEEVSGIRVYSGIFPGADRTVLTGAAESFRSGGGVAILVSSGDGAAAVLASGNERIDCRKVLAETLEPFGGRGGGKTGFAQGGIPDAGDAEALLASLRASVVNSLVPR